MYYTYNGYPFFALYNPGAKLLLLLAILWTLAWKGLALWKAGRNGHLAWFVALFVLNTLGILEIIYIFGFSRAKEMKARATDITIS